MENNYCRLCLHLIKNEKAMNLFQINTSYNIVEWISKVFDIIISEFEPFSKYICNMCFKTLDNFNNYSTTIKMNNQYLLDHHSTANGKDIRIKNNIDTRSDEIVDYLSENDEKTVTNDDFIPYNDNIEISSTKNRSNDENTREKYENVRDSCENNDGSIQIQEANSKNSSIDGNLNGQTSRNSYNDDTNRNNENNSRNNSDNDDISCEELENYEGVTENIPQILEEKPNHSSIKTPPKRKRKTPYPETANDVEIKKFYKYECDLCSNHGEIPTFRIFKHHYRDHHGIAAYIRCCGKRFTKPYQLVEHIEEHLAPESLVCPTCNKKLRTKKTLLYHMDKHVPVEKRPLKCKHCEARFSRNHHLIQHERIHISDDKKSVCDLCGKRFPMHWFLKSHLETAHSDERRFFCEMCGKAFKSNVQLQNHKYTHNSKDKPYKQCEICGACCRSPRQYYCHMRERHDETAPKNFPCEKCGHISPTKKALYAHTINKHGPKKLSCSFCHQLFSSNNLLKSHMVKHTGPGEPLKCPYCPKIFSFRSGLYSHRKRVHSDMIITDSNKK